MIHMDYVFGIGRANCKIDACSICIATGTIFALHIASSLVENITKDANAELIVSVSDAIFNGFTPLRPNTCNIHNTESALGIFVTESMKASNFLHKRNMTSMDQFRKMYPSAEIKNIYVIVELENDFELSNWEAAELKMSIARSEAVSVYLIAITKDVKYKDLFPTYVTVKDGRTEINSKGPCYIRLIN